MLLFLDTTSPLPEFSIIEDNKIVYSKKIIINNDEKMSDSIIPTYISIDNKFSLSNKLKCLIINVGPGSYTALRVGISFFLGLSISKKIPIKAITSYDLFHYSIDSDKINKTAIFLTSGNNQNFICLYDFKNKNYKISKFDQNFNLSKIVENKITYIVSNSNLVTSYIKIENIQYDEQSFKELVLQNIESILLLPNNEIIEPIYISNNKILN